MTTTTTTQMNKTTAASMGQQRPTSSSFRILGSSKTSLSRKSQKMMMTMMLMIMLGRQQPHRMMGGIPAVHAWGKLGHEIVGNVAWKLLDAGTRDVVSQILQAEDATKTTMTTTTRDDHNMTLLGAIADWADQVRHTHDYSWSGALHYIDVKDNELPASCRSTDETTTRGVVTHAVCDFVWTRDCGVDNFCVTGALENYTHRMTMMTTRLRESDKKNDDRSSSTSNATVVEALKFVTHFVGDVHQPLHVSRTSDRGGNSIAVHVNFRPPADVGNYEEQQQHHVAVQRHRRLRGGGIFPRDGPVDTHFHDHSNELDSPNQQPYASHYHTNLHGVWDDVLLETLQHEECHNDWTLLQDRVVDVIVAAQEQDRGTRYEAWTKCPDGGRHVCLDIWAQESWDLAQRWAYRHVNGTQIHSNDVLTREYYETRIPIVMEQLAKASVRLAYTLQWNLKPFAS